jgi:regulator of protease activity HflC (stomatin/prohibitin superfamily)
MNIFDIFGNLLNWFGSFVPRILIVRKSHKGIAFVHGNKVKILEPGLRVYWPLVTEVEIKNITRQTLHFATQTLTTKDKKSIVCDGSIVYRVNDITKYVVDTADVNEAIVETCMAMMRKVIKSHTYEELLDLMTDNKMDLLLTEEAEIMVSEFGVKVVYVRLSDFSATKVLTLTGSVAQAYTYT